MNYFYNLLFLIAFLTVFLTPVQCVKEINLELPTEKPRLVVNGNFEPGQPFKVRISVSQPVYIGSKPPGITNAIVRLEQEGELIEFLSEKLVDGQVVWESKHRAKANVPYSLAVQAGALDPVSATGYAPPAGRLHHIVVLPDSIVRKPLNDSITRWRIPLELTMKTPLPAQPWFGFQVKGIAGHYPDLSVPLPILDSLAQHPASVVTDGRTFALIHQLPENMSMLNENFWRKSDQTLKMQIEMDVQTANEWPHALFLTWFTLSEDFYRYHLSLSRQGFNSPLSEPDALYNNISGGYGNFSGFSRDTQTIWLPK
jgi:Domain of unknown function (DUF4249)